MGGETIWGRAANDTIYGDKLADYLSSGQTGGDTIYGGGGSNIIYGDAIKLHGTVYAQANTIWADGPNADDHGGTNTIYGNAVYMYGHAQSAGNTIYDSSGTKSTIYGNAQYMNDDASGGHNHITALSTNSTVYGDAQNVNVEGGFSESGIVNPVVQGGYNTIIFDSQGSVYGDAQYIHQGLFQGGHNTIVVNDGSVSTTTVYGTGGSLTGDVQAGYNTIYAGAGHDTIFGDWVSNNGGGAHGGSVGGYNTIYAGTGINTIYGDVQSISTPFTGGHNTIYAGTGDGSGHQGAADIWGGMGGGFDTFVFKPGTGQVTIEDFDQHNGAAFSHAQGDALDVSAYHLNPTFGAGGVAINSDANGNAVVNLPPTSDHASQITLVGVHAADLHLTDFHF